MYIYINRLAHTQTALSHTQVHAQSIYKSIQKNTHTLQLKGLGYKKKNHQASECLRPQSPPKCPAIH